MMRPRTFPTELKLEICRYVDGRQEIVNLSASDSTFLRICRPILYKNVGFKLNDIASVIRTVQLCRTILGNRPLGLLVRGAQVDDLDNRREVTRAGGALVHLVIKTLRYLERLRSLSIRMKPGVKYTILHPTLTFPHLEAFSGVVNPNDIPFFKRHPNIKKFEPMIRQWESLPQGSASGFMPNLMYYSGCLSLLRSLPSEVPLERVSFQVSFPVDYPEDIAFLFRKYGSRLRALDVKSINWEAGFFKTITEGAPQLETLWIQPKGPQATIVVVEDILSSNASLTSLRELGLLDTTKLWSPRCWQLQSDRLYQLHRACPSLRLVNFATYVISNQVSDADVKNMWRYHERKQCWIPPKAHATWWKTTAPKLGISTKDYESVIPRRSGIHGPFFDGYPLV